MKEYNDLDQMAMGVITADEAYVSTGGRFSWMEPWYSAPLPYLAGVFVAFSAQDFLYIGFDADHRKLGVFRTDGTRYGEADLVADYHPWPGRRNTGVAPRVLYNAGDPLHHDIREGLRLIFQARFDDSALLPTVDPGDFNVFVGPLPAQIPGLFEGLNVRGPFVAPPSSPDFSGFHTVATVPIRQRPLGVGLISKASVPVWADAVYSHLETLTPLLTPPQRVNPIPCTRSRRCHRRAGRGPVRPAARGAVPAPAGEASGTTGVAVARAAAAAGDGVRRGE